MRFPTCLAFSVWLFSAIASAEELLPIDSDVAEVIDHYVDERLERYEIEPTPPADAATYLRRAALDLAGRIPTTAEYAWAEELPESERREAIVEHLMSLADFDFHLRNSLDELLLSNRPHDGEFREYLLWAVRSGRSWDQIFRDLLLARPAEGPERGAAQFVRSRVRNLDDLTNDTAMLLFGVNIACAKCHDHPLVDQWQQDHYFGMQAFFSRTFATRKNVLTERPFGEVKFKNTAGEEKVAAFTFLSGVSVEDQTIDFADDERKRLEEQLRKLERDEKAGYVLFPDFSPRRELVDVALRDEEYRYFAKNIVNRTWERLMGLGLVDPPDQMHDGNLPSHPELLEWLAEHLVANRYDLRGLIRGIVMSDAYSRSSRLVTEERPPSPTTFARALTRPLTPRQLATSLLVVARGPAEFPAAERQPDIGWARFRNDLENQAGGWVREFERPTENFQVSVDEALFFSNSDRVQNDLLRDSGGSLVGRLLAIDDDRELLRQLWIRVLGREPLDDEVSTGLAWLSRDATERSDAIRSLAWAVITGPEARFNH